jgi:hypothetical protein
LHLRAATWPGSFSLQSRCAQPASSVPGAAPGIFNWRAIEADALIGLGRPDDAEIALREFEGAIPQAGLASAALAVARCRGNLAMASGHASQAEAAFTRGHLIEAACRCRLSTPC